MCNYVNMSNAELINVVRYTLIAGESLRNLHILLAELCHRLEIVEDAD